MRDKTPLFQRVVTIIRNIPKGKVLTYAKVAQYADTPGCARHVSYILSSSSRKYDLPWHRVLNSKGEVAIKIGHGHFKQRKLLINENIEFKGSKIELDIFLWKPKKTELMKILKGLPKHIPLSERVNQ